MPTAQATASGKGPELVMPRAGRAKIRRNLSWFAAAADRGFARRPCDSVYWLTGGTGLSSLMRSFQVR